MYKITLPAAASILENFWLSIVNLIARFQDSLIILRLFYLPLQVTLKIFDYQLSSKLARFQDI